MSLPPDTIEVKPENKCDVCKKKDAKYYNIRFYIHICSNKCLEEFVAGYNREIEEISRRILDPDETGTIRKRKEKNDL